MTERSHHSFLLALKSRVLVVSKERRRKAKTLGLLARSSKVVPFPVLLRTARCSSAIPSTVFPTFSSVSPLYIFTSAVFVSTTNESRRKIAFYSFWSRAAVWLHSLRSKKFSSLSLFSLSLSLSLLIIYTYIYEKKLKKSSSKPVVVV